MALVAIPVVDRFLLTRPMRDVTFGAGAGDKGVFVSTHTPHAGRDEFGLKGFAIVVVSTHTPHAGRDMRSVAEIHL